MALMDRWIEWTEQTLQRDDEMEPVYDGEFLWSGAVQFDEVEQDVFEFNQKYDGKAQIERAEDGGIMCRAIVRGPSLKEPTPVCSCCGRALEDPCSCMEEVD